MTADLVARAGTSLSAPWLSEGTAWWLEGRAAEAGRVVVVRAEQGSEPEDVTAEGFNVRSMVHEYGGGAYCVKGRTVYFSNFENQRLYRQDPGAVPIPITAAVSDRRQRYADGRITDDGTLWIGVRERHEDRGPAAVVNELVAVPTDGSTEPRVIASGRDFYAAPRISPNGAKLSYLAWDLPWMPWDGCELHVADLHPDGTLGAVTHIAGRDGEESIWQPCWSPGGDLVFASDRSGWWSLERLRGEEREVLHAADAEFGYPAWALGSRSFGFLADGRIVCAYDSAGRTSFAILDPDSGELDELDLPHDAIRSPGVAVEGSTVLLVAGSATLPSQIVRLDATTGSFEVVRSSLELPVDTESFSIPEPIEFSTAGGLTAHALHYRPVNPGYTAEIGDLPPLIVMSHGGPTANTTSLFSLELQFWTTRGFAVVDVNYGGSTGYGRAYRERLNGMWGVVDLQDCVNAARYLVEHGEADPQRLLITGGSAGGYTTICALTFTDEFAAGTSYFGLADLEPFASGDTHKFESRYEHTLVGPYPEAADLYRERSPINFVDQISTPMLVLQGEDDEVVPKSQAELIVEALRKRGIPYAYLLFPGEGHGFRKAENIVRSLEAELSFYAQVLGFEPGDPLPKLPIENLTA
jgi:dipeptidyl aminopeptidase/acylaminoacyl peptidase